MHTTNYFNTLIEIAEDCPISAAEIPPQRGEKKSIANLQFELIMENPYKYSSDDLFFKVFAIRKELLEGDLEGEREHFFSKGQPCFRASPLPKRYGWGVHSNEDGKVAIYPVESKDYQKLLKDKSIAKVKAMRSKRK